MRPHHRSAARGFTLIEILVALFIFAVLGLIGTQLVGRVTQQQAALSERGGRLIEVQRAMQILKRDFMQMQQRAIRDGLGDPRPALVLEEDAGIEFTRLGWRNPLRQSRSDEQRIAYVFDEREKRLLRLFWPVLDRAQDTEPVRQVLLTEVEEAEFEVIAANGSRSSYWPQVIQGGAGLPAAAIRLRIEVVPYGRIDRMWEVPSVQ
jgi:general secretion pathway protein J